MRRVVIVTGLSGSGRTTALRALEDLGYFCMDNLPVVLLPKVLDLASSGGEMEQIAVGVDAREHRFIEHAGEVVDQIKAQGLRVNVLFLDASEEAIIQRFSATRRPHPLVSDGDVTEAIGRERMLLEDLRQRADVVVDTTNLTVHELRAYIQDGFSAGSARRMVVRVVSFGFKHGLPPEADLVFDVRFLQNPYFVPDLRSASGSHPAVASFVLDQADAADFLHHLYQFLSFLIPRFVREGKATLTIAIGCTGGRHRSVALAETVAQHLSEQGLEPRLVHRDRAES